MGEYIPITELLQDEFQSLKRIVIKEYGRKAIADEEIFDMGLRICNLYLILFAFNKNTEKSFKPQVSLSTKELQAFQYIEFQLKQRNHSPSAREVAKAMGYSSSRTGLKMINILVEKGVVRRGEKGRLEVSDGLDMLKSTCGHASLSGSAVGAGGE
jgi:hypothetical protein